MKPSEMKRRQSGPAFHKNPFWQHAAALDSDSDKDHAPFSLHKLEEGLFRAMGMRARGRRHSSASEATPLPLPHFARRLSTSEEIVQFRRINIPSENSYDGSVEKTANTLTRVRTGSSNNSLASRDSHAGGFWVTDKGWNVAKLLELTDTTRAALAKGGRKLTLSERNDLNFVMDMMLDDEVSTAAAASMDQKITFAGIQRARLDRLLVEILGAYDRETTTVPVAGVNIETGLGSEINTATDLQQRWQSRFKTEYSAIDKYRSDKLMAEKLRDVVWSATASEGMGVWMPTGVIDYSEVEGNTRFVAGQWWLNIGCAHRDGIVGAAVEKATKGRYGVAALALLTGQEETLPDGKTVYIREGPHNDVHNNLISQVGQKIRILRGFRLRSMNAPKAGVRYDGVYRMRSWSIKLNMVSEIYTLRLIIDRLPKQKPMEEITIIPRPSQLDDWNLYEQLESSHIRNTEGKTKFAEWAAGRKVERGERDQWRRNRDLKNSLREKELADAAADIGSLRSAMYWPGGAGSSAASGFTEPRRRKLSEIDTTLLPPPSEVPEEEEQSEK